MIPRMVEVSKYNGKSWEPSGTAVFHGFFSDYEEFEAGPGNYPASLIEWEDGKIESVVAHSVRFLVPTLELGDELARVEGSWLSKEMRTPAKGFPAIRTVEPGVSVVIREPGHVCDGMFGIVASKFGVEDLWSVDIGKTTHAVLSSSSLEVR